MREGKGEVIRPAGMAGQEDWLQAAAPELLLERGERADGELIILGQRADEASLLYTSDAADEL